MPRMDGYPAANQPDGSEAFALMQGGATRTVTLEQVLAFIQANISTGGGDGGGTTPPPTSTRARFAQDTATAGAGGTAAALFASMVLAANPSSDRSGTITTTADQTKYTWVAVLASAAGSGMHFFDGTGFGGFSGAASPSVYTGPDADPTTLCQTYTDGSGRVWNLYRSSGHSVALTFTLS